ncbi:hypothetical protein LL972_15390 [Xanthomonas campestris pv. asclepiadis]|uniref:hypothetical protein n=1 Tax=Xanthomonas campestris TaxID=339 RepID=UPI001E49D479|nr:hypothetical protein [Xanthomonas campestris]MCC4617367.1 hypothetical protein [Xanthomonas campestris pv. asclepiadis]
MSKNNNAPVWLAQTIVCSGSNGISHSKALRKSKILTLSSCKPVMRRADKGHFLHTAVGGLHRTLHAMRSRIEDKAAAKKGIAGLLKHPVSEQLDHCPGMTRRWLRAR